MTLKELNITSDTFPPHICPKYGGTCPLSVPATPPPLADNGRIEETLRQLICSQLNLTPEKLTPEADFYTDLGADSLDCMELLLAIEEEFSIFITEAEAENLTNLRQSLDLLQRKLREKEASRNA